MSRQVFAAVLLAAIGFGPVPALVFVPPATAHAGEEKKARATFEVYRDKAGEYRWRLRATNKQVLATSGEGYKEKRSCLAAIESVKRAATDAPVEELSAQPAK
jgi:uncharacterized protein YegP (UPF0339 family)